MINQKVLKSLLTATAMLMATLLIGITGFYAIEGYSLLDSIYMTFITMSTVGYGILEGELTDTGKVFVIFLVIFTVGTFTYAITRITTLMVEGEIRNLVKGYRVNKEINKLRDHIIICGLGRNGRQAAMELTLEGESWVGIENDKEVIDSFMEHHPSALVLHGDATEEDLLLRAGIEDARGVISALASDAANVFVTLTIRQLNPKVNLVARASSESTISKLEIAGADHVIMPNVLGGRKMAKIITKPALMDFVDMITGQGQFHLHLEEVDIEAGSNLIGKSLRNLDIRSKTGVLVLGRQSVSGKFELNPSVSKIIEDGEKLFIIGSSEQLESFRREFT